MHQRNETHVEVTGIRVTYPGTTIDLEPEENHRTPVATRVLVELNIDGDETQHAVVYHRQPGEQDRTPLAVIEHAIEVLGDIRDQLSGDTSSPLDDAMAAGHRTGYRAGYRDGKAEREPEPVAS